MWIITISCAWILGILLAPLINVPSLLIFLSLLPISLAFFWKRRRKYLILSAFFIITFFAAIIYYPHNFSSDKQIAAFNEQGTVDIEGLVLSPPEVRDNITHVELSVHKVNGQSLRGKILLFVPRFPEYHYGDVLSIKGDLKNPPQFDEFDYQAALAKQNIYSTMLNPQIHLLAGGAGFKPFEWIFSLRDILSKSLSAILPEPQASLAQGIILGIRSTIPDDLKTNLSITGTAHLLAISGINLSIVAGLLVTLGIWLFGRRYHIYVWITFVVIWFYALITGMQAPVIRAAVMASVFLLAEFFGRPKNALVALSLTAAVMVGLEPRILASISFQMSFLAMLGLIFISPVLQNLSRRAIDFFVSKDHPAHSAVILITDSFSIAIGAVLAVWPVIAFNFGIISFIGPLATVLLAPILSPIIVLGVIAAVAGVFSPLVGLGFGWLLWVPLSCMQWLVNFFASFSISAAHIESINVGIIWIYYFLLFLVLWIKSHFQLVRIRTVEYWNFLKYALARSLAKFSSIPKKYYLIPLLSISFLTSISAATLPDKSLHVSFLNVGEGDAILVQYHGRNILIDGGPSPQKVCLGISEKLPFWDRNLDLVILTHPHLDHLTGLVEVLQRYHVEQILTSDLTSTSSAYQEWLTLIQEHNIPTASVQAGQRIVFENGAVLEVLNTPDNSSHGEDDNLENQGLVLRLSYGKNSFLFTADIEQEAESGLINLRADLGCTVLKVAHHGSSNSTSAEFIAATRPQIAVISVGIDNPFGHPDPGLLERLSRQTVYRTDLSGTIEFTTDGQNLWVKTDKY